MSYVEFGCGVVGKKIWGCWRVRIKRGLGGLVSPGEMVKINLKIKW
jgi:hypothetical protein